MKVLYIRAIIHLTTDNKLLAEVLEERLWSMEVVLLAPPHLMD
jgi:hypothetical protein